MEGQWSCPQILSLFIRAQNAREFLKRTRGHFAFVDVLTFGPLLQSRDDLGLIQAANRGNLNNYGLILELFPKPNPCCGFTYLGKRGDSSPSSSNTHSFWIRN
jgi:hypothetical protein